MKRKRVFLTILLPRVWTRNDDQFLFLKPEKHVFSLVAFLRSYWDVPSSRRLTRRCSRLRDSWRYGTGIVLIIFKVRAQFPGAVKCTSVCHDERILPPASTPFEVLGWSPCRSVRCSNHSTTTRVHEVGQHESHRFRSSKILSSNTLRGLHPVIS